MRHSRWVDLCGTCRYLSEGENVVPEDNDLVIPFHVCSHQVLARPVHTKDCGVMIPKTLATCIRCITVGMARTLSTQGNLWGISLSPRKPCMLWVHRMEAISTIQAIILVKSMERRYPKPQTFIKTEGRDKQQLSSSTDYWCCHHLNLLGFMIYSNCFCLEVVVGLRYSA